MLAALALGAAAAATSGCLFLAPRPDVGPGTFRERTVVLVVDGPAGLPFEGSYGTPGETTAVRGVAPAQFTVKTAVGVVATFTKSAADGELVVRVMVDGQEIQRRATSAPFGTVTVSQLFSR